MDQELLAQEVTSEHNRFQHTVAFVKPTERGSTPPSPAQLQVHFVCLTQHQYFNKLSCDHEAALINYFEETSEDTREFDLRAIMKNDEWLSHISPVLSEFGIAEDSDDRRRIVRDIAIQGRRLRGLQHVFRKEEGLITLEVVISREHDMLRCESCLLDRVTRESMTMAEETEKVKVLASESSIKKLQKKRVRVEEGESCSVCLEEFRAGTYETSMDCSHVFHRECILKWLRESRYCPVCRYEMPADDDGGS